MERCWKFLGNWKITLHSNIKYDIYGTKNHSVIFSDDYATNIVKTGENIFTDIINDFKFRLSPDNFVLKFQFLFQFAKII